MRIDLRLLTLRHKVYWFWCLIFAAKYADWKRITTETQRSRRGKNEKESGRG